MEVEMRIMLLDHFNKKKISELFSKPGIFTSKSTICKCENFAAVSEDCSTVVGCYK